MASVPFSAFASTPVTGTIDATTLTTTSSKPTIKGTADGAKTITITVKKEGSTATYYKSHMTSVHSGKWSAKIWKDLSNGTYDLTVTGGSKTLATGKLAVGTSAAGSVTSTAPASSAMTPAATTLVVSSVPLLFGGTAHMSAAVPVSYLQITNIGKVPATLKGFWIKQNGSAPTTSVIGLSTVDDKGGSRGAVGGFEGNAPFVNGAAYAPTAVTVLLPGEMKLFTIKTQLTSNIASYLGKQLVIDVTGIDTNAAVQGTFPIHGTTWSIAY
jgi:hypothetical protein